MKVHLGGIRQILPSTLQHLSDWYDRGYLDHQWGYTHRSLRTLTDAQQRAYQAGWRAAAEDGTAECYARPRLSHPPPADPLVRRIPATESWVSKRVANGMGHAGDQAGWGLSSAEGDLDDLEHGGAIDPGGHEAQLVIGHLDDPDPDPVRS
jgi:hypothetical protein